MGAAPLVLFALFVGLDSISSIVCGWQPMPDGSLSYECVVQLEPELVESLKSGNSIPLSVEVPEHVRPISRIRIIVGEGSLPQQAIVTSFKPWPEAEKESRLGVVETQYTTNSNDRYNYQQPVNGQITQVNGAISNAQDAFARSLQNGGQAVSNAATQFTQDVLPPEAGRNMANAVNQAGQELGNNLRNTGEAVRDDIRQLFGSDSTSAQVPASSQILPPGSNNAPAYSHPTSAPILPADNGAAGNTRRRLDQPITHAPTQDWQSIPTATSNSNQHISGQPPIYNQPGTFAAPWSSNQNQQQNPSTEADRYGTPTNRTDSAVLPQSGNNAVNNGGMTNEDRYGNFTQSQNNGFNTADNRNNQMTMNPQAASAGPSFPPFNPTTGNEQPITPTPHAPQTSGSVAEIRRDMLDQPANAEIRGANGHPVGQQPVSTASTTPAPAPTDFGWNTRPQTQPTIASAGVAAPPATSVFPLLLSWVLLSGSGAGNLYLFWSYLDVRNKYHDLVDEASRRISGRRVRD